MGRAWYPLTLAPVSILGLTVGTIFAFGAVLLWEPLRVVSDAGVLIFIFCGVPMFWVGAIALWFDIPGVKEQTNTWSPSLLFWIGGCLLFGPFTATYYVWKRSVHVGEPSFPLQKHTSD